jgi:hypothetical protein
MAPSATTMLLLTSLLTSTSLSFVPLTHLHPPIDMDKYSPLPTRLPDLDPAVWIPITVPGPTTLTPQPTPAPTQSPDSHAIPFLDRFLHPELHKRQGAPVTAAPVAQAGQVSPVTTYMENIKGVQQPVVYTQTFPAIPDQWPSPAAGSIGLGTIVGTVGAVRSKRAEPTQALIAPKQGANDEIELEKLVKILPVEEDRSGELGMRQLEDAMYTNDARRVIQAGTLAVLAVSIGTVCFSHLCV